MWYHEYIGGERCPIVDTWWQTETGHDHDLAAARASPTKPGLGDPARSPASRRTIVDEQGNEPCPGKAGGYLVIKRPWPAMLRTIYGDDERYGRTTGARCHGVYFTADGASRTRTATSGSWAASTTC